MEVGTQATSCAGRRGAIGELVPERRAAAAQLGRPPVSSGRRGRGGTGGAGTGGGARGCKSLGEVVGLGLERGDGSDWLHES
jgi:hypothetical protein